MIADLEEKTTNDKKRRQKLERRQNRERLLLQTKRDQPQQQRRRRSRVSSDEEALSAEQIQKLTEESRRLKVQELTRTINTAQEGDLRTLLQRRKSGGNALPTREQSNSDDEDVLERKLREKVKEEKHLRLFGKLTRSERARMKRETENLRKRLQKARFKRRERDGE